MFAGAVRAGRAQSIAVASKLTCGVVAVDEDGNGVTDRHRHGRTTAHGSSGSWSVEPFTGFTTSEFFDIILTSGAYDGSEIRVVGTNAFAIVSEYKSLTINGVKRSITWGKVDNNTAIYNQGFGGTKFGCSNGVVLDILFGK